MTDEPAGPPSYYPISLDLSNRPCLVVGAGAVATRKVRGLLDSGARVTVIAPDISEEMRSLASRLEALEPRTFQPDDVAGFRLVVTATGDPAVDGAVAAEADAAGVWVNSADDPAHCSFILPAVHRDGAVTIAVSTAGLSPALAAVAPEPPCRVLRGRSRHVGPTARRDQTATARRGETERHRRLGHTPRR